MTWLAPLFLAAGLAIAGPIVFHLWQKTPRGRRLFSSAMFLAPSPPRITRRSRIEHWLLLCLRGLALLLLAAAFARPIWRTEAQTAAIASPDKTVAILVDTSASLRRTGLFAQLQRDVLQRLNALPGSTHVALFAFDHDWCAVVPFESAEHIDAAAQRQLVREQLLKLKPGWGGTKLGDGLARTVQALRDFEASRPMLEQGELWLAGDFAAGADLAGLAGVDWPETLRLETITPDMPAGSNAGLQWVESRSDAADAELRVRVTNARHSTVDRFRISWGEDRKSDAVEIHVPAGQSRTVLAPPRSAKMADDIPLRLFGDDQDFDNRLWTVARRPRSLWILYLGRDAADDPAGSRFFLEQALAGASEADVSVAALDDIAEAGVSLDPPALAVWTDAELNPPSWLKRFLGSGGSLLAVPGSAEAARVMLAYQGLAGAEVSEAAVDEFALLSDIDFEDPLFAPFAQARFADFTGIHFWKHRRVRLPAPSTAQIVARFDDGDPFLLRQADDRGRFWMMTAGWHAADSQLARSSKFAPLLHRLLEQSTPILATATARREVGQGLAAAMLQNRASARVRRPDGSTEDWNDTRTPYRHVDLPGIYVAESGNESDRWAVNLAPDESKTDPLPIEALERFGVRTRPLENAAMISPHQQRQLQLEELERKQSLWRWCLFAALLVLLIETAWATRRAEV
jgi:hypothetical protein